MFPYPQYASAPFSFKMEIIFALFMLQLYSSLIVPRSTHCHFVVPFPQATVGRASLKTDAITTINETDGSFRSIHPSSATTLLLPSLSKKQAATGGNIILSERCCCYSFLSIRARVAHRLRLFDSQNRGKRNELLKHTHTHLTTPLSTPYIPISSEV